MKYLKQFSIILAITCVGEILKTYIPLPIPASIYGLVLMLALLISGKLRLESVREAVEFLIAVMPVMFIPPAVGLMTSWEQLRPILVPVAVITAATTWIVMIAAGKAADFMISRKEVRR